LLQAELTMKKKNQQEQGALKVNKGVEKPSIVNPALSAKIKNKFKKEPLTVEQYFNGIRQGDNTILSRAITLIESTRPEDKQKAIKLINKCLPFSGNSIRIGITGVPGVGKSTFIEAFGLLLIGQKKKIAVLAIDPSSSRTKGSILGDKTRMEKLSTSQNAFIRPSSSAGTLGGVARNTRESIVLCEAAGFDTILIETVGVGQSETAVAQMVDFFLLLMLAGGGDELQGIKRGIMEMADLIVINKTDGDNKQKAELAKREYQNALHLFPANDSGWTPDVITASSLEGTGLTEIQSQIEKFVSITRENNYFEHHRKQQLISIMNETIRDSLTTRFYTSNAIEKQIKNYENKILNDKITPYEAAEKLLTIYKNNL
jgi:LAO/AO transport system kinase